MKDDRRLLRLVIVVLAVVGTATTTGRTDAYGYDVRSSAPLSVLAPSGPEGSPVQPSVTWEQPISPSVEARGTTTTPPARSVATNSARGSATGSVDELLSDVNVSGPYRRPSTGTTASQRASVQGQPCRTCGGGGGVDDVMRADHYDPYYERYLRGEMTFPGALDDAAVGPQCGVCSAQQGASY